MDTPAIDENYQVDNQMLIIVINLVYRLKRDCYFCDIALLVYTLFMYSKFSGEIYFFAYCEAAMILVLGLVQFFILSAKSKFVNKTAIEVHVTDNYIDIKTAAFNGPLWFKKESIELRIKRAGTVVKQVNNPYPNIFKQNKQITRIRYQGKDAYIVNGYFSPKLEDLLRQD